MEAETITTNESKHHHNLEAASDTESDQLDWDPDKIDDDSYPLVDENGSTLVPIPREGLLDEDEASSLTAWAQGYREVLKTCAIQSQDVVITNFSQAGSRESCEKLCSRRNHRGETETSAHHSETKREITAQNACHWTRAEKKHSLLPLQTTWTHGERVSESSTEGHSHNLQPRIFFCQEMPFAQLHSLSSYMLFDGASKTVVGCNSDPKHPEFIGLILGPARGLTDTGAQQPVVGSSAALRWCDRLLKRHGLVPVDVTPTNMIATCGGIGTAKVVQVLDFPPGIVGVNGVMRFLVLEGPMSTDGRQLFIPPLRPITIMRQLGANFRMKESGDVLEIEDDRGTIHTEKLVRERSGHVHNQLDFFSREGWKLPDSLRGQLKHDPFIASNRHEKCSYGKYEFKDEKQAKLVPTAECYGLDALETVNTSTGETARDDELPEDLWPNLNAMVTRLQQLYIGNHEEKLTAREHGFDRDFWAGSPSDCTTKLYRVHVKPRSSMFDPRQCATSPIPVGVEIVSRKTYLRETRGRRVAQLEHNFNDDKDVWSGTVEGTKWIGVSVFHVSVAVTPHVMRTGKGRETGTGYSKPYIQPERRPRDVSWQQPPSGTWGETETPQAHWNWDERQRQETSLKHESWTWSSNQTGRPKQSPEPGVASARSDECDSGIEDDCVQINSDTTVRPVTLPEGWTVVQNSLRQVVYCHVKSGIACFQMPENPELLNDLKFENGSSSGSGDLSRKRRSDCERNVSNHPEHNKLKICCGDHPQRSSQYVENQVIVKSPSCWTDPFQARLDKRRTTELTRTERPLLRDIIELKQAALWHGGKVRIDQASEAAAEGMMRQPKVLRSSFRSEDINSSSATSSQTLHPPSCASSSSAVEVPQMCGGTCREQSSTDASDSSMCGSNCASRLERATGSSRKISRRKGNFPVASIPVAGIPHGHSFHSPVMSDDSGRNSREEIAGSTRDKKSTPLGK